MDWDYLTEPQKELDGRQIYWPRGKMLGGSSSMNAMMWVRGFAADYDEWGDAGRASDWDFAHVAEVLRRESKSGPLVISRQRSPRSSTAAWLTAAQECGYPDREAESPLRRKASAKPSSPSAGALGGVPRTPISSRSCERRNLTLLTEATATRVLFDGHTRRRCRIRAQVGQRQVVRARREVVLCGGAVNSPQLLMLSGIGDREQLADTASTWSQHAPEVGQNLIDHLVAPLGFDVQNDTLFAAEKPLQLLNYLIRRRGMLTSNVGEAYGFVRSRPELRLPDLELIFAPAPFFDEGLGDPYGGHAVVIGPILLKPHSRGSITLRSADPKDKPIIDPRYLTDDAGVDRGRADGGPADVREDRRITGAAWRDRHDRQAGRVRRARRRHARRGTQHAARTPCTTRSAPAGWAATTPAWWTRICGSAASTDCGSPTRR